MPKCTPISKSSVITINYTIIIQYRVYVRKYNVATQIESPKHKRSVYYEQQLLKFSIVREIMEVNGLPRLFLIVYMIFSWRWFYLFKLPLLTFKVKKPKMAHKWGVTLTDRITVVNLNVVKLYLSFPLSEVSWQTPASRKKEGTSLRLLQEKSSLGRNSHLLWQPSLPGPHIVESKKNFFLINCFWSQ